MDLVEGGWIRVDENDLIVETITEKCRRCPDVGDCLREVFVEFMVFKIIVERSEEWRN